MLDVDTVLRWSDWIPLRESGRATSPVPRSAGLYRIRREGGNDLDYIGQTGLGTMTLRKRLTMLNGVYADVMPFRDPHTAAPALWALRHATGCDFEVSVVPVAGDTAWRKGLEALAIALYRQEHGRSPTVEFGRIPVGYRPSSHNNRRLFARGLVLRGGVAEETVEAHLAGIPPAGPLTGHSHSGTWGGHMWSPWTPLGMPTKALTGGAGLYRIRGDDGETLLYIGQGLIPSRPASHFHKIRVPEHPQGIIFAAQQRFEVSWVINGVWLPHHRLELENDLIGAHLLETSGVPAAQFLG